MISLSQDPNQLPPTVLSTDAQRLDYEQSLFVRLQKADPQAVLLLSIQYRMHPEISRFPSLMFYDSKLMVCSLDGGSLFDALQDGPDLITRNAMPWHSHAKGIFPPFCFMDISGKEELSSRTQSLLNMDEVTAVVQLFEHLCLEYPEIAVGD